MVLEKLKKKTGTEAGFSLVEFSIVVFLLILLVFGIIDFALLFYNQQVVTNAGREGARLGIVARPEDQKVNKADIIQEVNDFAESNIVSIGEENFSVVPSFASGGDYCAGFQDVLSVQVTYDYHFAFLPLATKTLGATATMICE
jgi:competence protein ComGC